MIDVSEPALLGDAPLDHDHAQLFRLCRALLDVPGDAIRPALAQLRAEMGAHFASEDADLRRLGGNNADCHLDEHAAVLASLDEVHLILGEPQTSQAVAQRLMSSLALELLRWLPEHVSEMDANLAAVRSQSRFGGVGVRFTPRLAQAH